VKLNGLYHKFAQWDKSIRLLENLLQMVPSIGRLNTVSRYLPEIQPADKAVQLFFELFDAGLEDNNVRNVNPWPRKFLPLSRQITSFWKNSNPSISRPIK
jgi:hypothetical protein